MTDADARHRLLEGVLLRLARLPECGGFFLRGGVLLRHWLRPLPRPADDLDLVAAFPFGVEETTRRYRDALADDTVGDGVTFAADRARFEAMRVDTGSPAVRVFARGEVQGAEAEFATDIVFGPPPRPSPEWITLPTGCGLPARVWASRPEAVAAQKVKALWFQGVLGWRPKDLDDLRLMLERVPMDPAVLRGAEAGYFADVNGTLADARGLFGPDAWWGTKMASARWLDYAAAVRWQAVPTDLPAVVAGVGGGLDSIWEGDG